MDCRKNLSGSQSHRACMDFLGRRLAARTLPPVTIPGIFDWRCKTNGQQCLNNSQTPSFSAWADIGQKPASSQEIISPTKDRMFLADTHHRDVSAFSRIACAPCYFFNKASYYPSDFSFNETRISSSERRSSDAVKQQRNDTRAEQSCFERISRGRGRSTQWTRHC
ncbi:hypothetical protein TNCV_5025511 [Trichonephila clavipes]|nr:hypothetical protein TNCV_5025511 [Trichonephila clavipes]